MMTTTIGVLFLLLLCNAVLIWSKVDDYAVVIDAGSTGSRCFVFHVKIDHHPSNIEEDDEQREVSSASCGKVIPGLSTFIDNPDEASAYLAPLLENAARLIPSLHHLSTNVYIKATAGMRLLSKDVQHQLWEALVRGANRNPDVPFIISENHIGTIDGHQEAFYAVLASNYIAKSIDGNLSPLPGKPLLGALDMGGSSTQLIFYNGSNEGSKINAGDFWAYSWLNYGAQKVQERLLEYIHSTYNNNNNQTCNNSNAENNQCEERGRVVIDNPCGFIGHQFEWKGDILQGTGEGKRCFDLIERIIWPDIANSADPNSDCFKGRPCPIEEIEHPSVKGHHFYAMSVYFFALDCMRQLGPQKLTKWPMPTLEEIETAAFEFCQMQWQRVYEDFSEYSHPYTRVNQLADRCFEVLYITTLLERGFGFDRHERTITYALEVEGSEVEWTLGFALAEIDFVPHHSKIPIVAKNSFKYLLKKQSTSAMNILHSFFRIGLLSIKSYGRTLYRRLKFSLGI